jgi:hypothetical protein
MKIIKYNMLQKVNMGDPSEPNYVEVLYPTTVSWTEKNEEFVKTIAFEGIYEVVDDGNPPPPPTEKERIAELEEMINVLLGVSE